MLQRVFVFVRTDTMHKNNGHLFGCGLVGQKQPFWQVECVEPLLSVTMIHVAFRSKEEMCKYIYFEQKIRLSKFNLTLHIRYIHHKRQLCFAIWPLHDRKVVWVREQPRILHYHRQFQKNFKNINCYVN